MVGQSSKAGILQVVATPIGNLEDIGQRALRVLAEADCILAEDTRHSRKLLQHYGITSALESMHEHNERDKVAGLVSRLEAGQRLALISDAGTPLVSDPGYPLVAAAHAAGIEVSPVPGPSAVIAALSVAGLPTDRFRFEGFLPTRAAARCRALEQCHAETATLVFYESSHRIAESLADMAQVLGTDRPAALARELTKRFETIRRGNLGQLARWVEDEADQRRGEFVVVVQGAAKPPREKLSDEARHILEVLAQELPLKQAARLAASITGESRNSLYKLALALKGG